jgi:hypothetical protein
LNPKKICNGWPLFVSNRVTGFGCPARAMQDGRRAVILKVLCPPSL